MISIILIAVAAILAFLALIGVPSRVNLVALAVIFIAAVLLIPKI